LLTLAKLLAKTFNLACCTPIPLKAVYMPPNKIHTSSFENKKL